MNIEKNKVRTRHSKEGQHSYTLSLIDLISFFILIFKHVKKIILNQI